MKQKIAEADETITLICDVAAVISACLDSGGKVLLMGNGGSAADAQHIAAEFVGKFMDPARRALPALALTTDSSILTSMANDFGFEYVFERQIEALGQAGDVVVAISTSGMSENVLRGVRAAHSKGLTTVALTGSGGGKLASDVDYAIRVPSDETSRIQETHICIGHVICTLVDARIAT